ncbi:MAG: PH domain-containing protein [Lacunisphaera sp.]|jgi:membrane protein YdbS with pleckstrin-like domain|nr:PH domain-containing protein [Lacunisphaera sp.]
MYNRYSSLVLRWLKVPPEPHPPFGDPASLRVFRAGKNYYKLRMFGWGAAEFVAFVGILFWALVFVYVEETATYEKARRTTTAQVVAERKATLAAQARQAAENLKTAGETALKNMKDEGTKSPAPAKKPVKRRARAGGGWNGFITGLVEIAILLPPWAFPILWGLKIAGLTAYLLQLPLTYAIRRLDFEMRWYVVTDRSLRIRTGVWSVQESTMSFANLQQVEVSQGPLQRLLGLADVKVQSAGGSDNPHGKPQDDLHTGHFHGVDNAHEIRDLIQERLRRFRESGLGDPDEARQAAQVAAQLHAASVPTAPAAPDADVLTAARELAAEAKALRVALG